MINSNKMGSNAKCVLTLSLLMFMIPLINSELACKLCNTTSELDIIVHPPHGLVTRIGHVSAIHFYAMNITNATLFHLSVQSSIEETLLMKNGYKSSNQTELILNIEETANYGFANINILGLTPGYSILYLTILDASLSPIGPYVFEYSVKVTPAVNLVQDVFLYVLVAAEMMSLLMLGFRLRLDALREVLSKPVALAAGILGQVLIMPLVSLGSALSLGLGPDDLKSFLVTGCCPAAILSPMFAVLQHGHVELSVMLLLVQTVLAFGVVPAWMTVHDFFFSDIFEDISYPFYHISGNVGVVLLPIIIGTLVQKYAPKSLHQLDKAIHPTCLLLTMTSATVSIFRVWKIWRLVTWSLLIGSTMVPLISFFIGALLVSIFRRKLSQIKSVAIATGLQNTLLASVIIQTSYPATTASAMYTVVVCLEFTSLCLMYLLYVAHLLIWITTPLYRSFHDSTGITGIYRSLAERIVKRMIKAGEISLRRHRSGSYASSNSSSVIKISPSPTDSEYRDGKSPENSTSTASTIPHGFSNMGLRNKLFSTSFESMRHLSKTPLYLSHAESLSSESSKSFVAQFRERLIIPSSDTTDFESSEICIPSDSPVSESDSLSIDYDMLGSDASGKRDLYPASDDTTHISRSSPIVLSPASIISQSSGSSISGQTYEKRAILPPSIKHDDDNSLFIPWSQIKLNNNC